MECVNPPPQNPAANTLSPMQVAVTPQGHQAPLAEQAPEAVLTEQVHGQEPLAAQPELPKRKPARAPSNAWKHFIRVKDNAICKYCKKTYRAGTDTHGTSNMLKHLKACLQRIEGGMHKWFLLSNFEHLYFFLSISM